jgi:hypothetical protein
MIKMETKKALLLRNYTIFLLGEGCEGLCEGLKTNPSPIFFSFNRIFLYYLLK